MIVDQNRSSLDRQLSGLALLSIPIMAGFYFWALKWWSVGQTFRWLIGTLAAWGYLLFILQKNLGLNYRQTDETHTLLPNLGIGNQITIWRSLILAILGGFLFVPRPEGVYAILPGLLYTLGALPDFLDGYLARITNHVTQLGEHLDMTVDSVGMLIATTLGALQGQVPPWYVLLGLARYLFLAGLWLRGKRGLPTYEMPYSIRRRGLAGLQMGFMFVILWPQFQPPAAHLAAYCFGVPFLISFLWDWFVVCGRIPPDIWTPTSKLTIYLRDWLPLALRAVLIILAFPPLTPAPLPPITLIATCLLILGLLGRLAAITALISLAFLQLVALLTPLHLALIPIYVALLTLGTGKFSLWPLEDRWVYHRAGEQDRKP